MPKFLAFYGIATFAAMIIFLLKIDVARKANPGKRTKFSWKLFFRGFRKLLVTFMIIAPTIIFFKDISPFILNLGVTGDLPEGIDVVADVNAFTALIIGLNIDTAQKKIVELFIKKKQNP